MVPRSGANASAPRPAAAASAAARSIRKTTPSPIPTRPIRFRSERRRSDHSTMRGDPGAEREPEYANGPTREDDSLERGHERPADRAGQEHACHRVLRGCAGIVQREEGRREESRRRRGEEPERIPGKDEVDEQRIGRDELATLEEGGDDHVAEDEVPDDRGDDETSAAARHRSSAAGSSTAPVRRRASPASSAAATDIPKRLIGSM